jgi:hypothetical protein
MIMATAEIIFATARMIMATAEIILMTAENIKATAKIILAAFYSVNLVAPNRRIVAARNNKGQMFFIKTPAQRFKGLFASIYKLKLKLR